MIEPPTLPLIGSVPSIACGVDDGCITCGDVAVVLTVVEVGPRDARCIDERGEQEWVATDLVGPLTAGARVLVHAKVALEALPEGDEA